EIHDHPRGCVRLPCARRSVDGEDARVEGKDHSACGRERILACVAERNTGSKTRIASEQEVSGCAVRTWRVNPVVAYKLAQSHEPRARLWIAHPLVLEERAWMKVSTSGALSETDHSMFKIDRLDLRERRRLRACPRKGIVVLLELRVLRRKRIAVDNH